MNMLRIRIGFIAGFIMYLTVALAVAVSTTTANIVRDTGVPGGAIGVQECKKATVDVWHLPYPGDCTKFVKCDILGNKSTIYTCDTPLHFNPSIQTCDWPEKAGCDASGSASSTTSGGGSGSSSTAEPVVTPTSIPSNNSTIDSTTSSSGGIGDVCAAATPDRWHLPYPGDCSKFIKCDLVQGTWHVFDCPTPLHFHAAIQVCDWPQNAGCDLGTTSPTTPSTTTTPSGCVTTTPVPDCTTPKPTPECPTPNPNPNPNPNPTPSTSQPPTGGNNCPSPFGPNDVCRVATDHHWHLPHPTDVTKFYKCEINSCRAFLFDCPAGLVFNPTIQVCDWP